MKNLWFTLFALPLLFMSQVGFAKVTNTPRVQMIAIDPADLILDNGLFIDNDGDIIPVQNLIINNSQLKAVVVQDEDGHFITKKGWLIFNGPSLFPKDNPYLPNPVEQKSHQKKGDILVVVDDNDEYEDEVCNCGCKDQIEEYVEVEGAIHNSLDQYFRKADRGFPFQYKQGRGCSKCKHRQDRAQSYFQNPKTGDIIVVIETDDDEDDQVVYLDQEEVYQLISEIQEEAAAEAEYEAAVEEALFEEALEEAIETAYEAGYEAALEEVAYEAAVADYLDSNIDEDLFDSTLILGYDQSGSFYTQRPTSIYQLRDMNKKSTW